MRPKPNFPSLLQQFFTRRLMQQRRVSSHTISSYRDTFRLLLQYVKKHLGKSPSSLSLEDLDAPLISNFLDNLEQCRGLSARSRNVRLTAIRSLFHYAAFERPGQSEQIQRVLSIPSKRCTRKLINFLTRSEIEALLAAPDLSNWAGQRDHAWLMVALQTGLRLSELTALTRNDINLGSTGAHVHVVGKGRKERCVPFTKQTALALKSWLKQPIRGNSGILFPTARGMRMSNDGMQYLLAKHVAVACKTCSSLRRKHVTPHVLRHSMAMTMLQAGIDTTVIALWLGHESVETTHIYLDADLALKEKILAKTTPIDGRHGVYKPDDPLLAFLKAL